MKTENRRSVIMDKIYKDRSNKATKSRLFKSKITFQHYYDLEISFFKIN